MKIEPMAIEVVITAGYSSADVEANKLEAHFSYPATEFISVVPALLHYGSLKDI